MGCRCCLGAWEDAVWCCIALGHVADYVKRRSVVYKRAATLIIRTRLVVTVTEVSRCPRCPILSLRFQDENLPSSLR
ncbi:hypothetical protein PISMIDRAFT_439191 [Pisolithus microcarpus 441]|uniref:Uncharacterized protein n=1 Tax=Pisolithus microcarpus 441 TaxID=765257 RepID=A0A0C9ZUM2_9AGAM|nr:hypothetical protein PISMIDRAFT_439191 [Pisolithus microcarpus 441]